MVDEAIGPRNRALVAVLYESGARLGEFMGLRIGSIEHTPYGWKIHVDGKTGRRPILLVNSGPYLAAWLSLHPFAPAAGRSASPASDGARSCTAQRAAARAGRGA